MGPLRANTCPPQDVTYPRSTLQHVSHSSGVGMTVAYLQALLLASSQQEECVLRAMSPT